MQQLPVAVLRRYVDVYQRHAQGQRRTVIEIRLDKLWPLLRDFTRNLGVPVARQVGENQLGTRFPRPAHGKEIDAAGTAGSGAGTGDLRADERIDDAGFADVGAAEKSDLRQG